MRHERTIEELRRAAADGWTPPAFDEYSPPRRAGRSIRRRMFFAASALLMAGGLGLIAYAVSSLSRSLGL